MFLHISVEIFFRFLKDSSFFVLEVEFGLAFFHYLEQKCYKYFYTKSYFLALDHLKHISRSKISCQRLYVQATW